MKITQLTMDFQKNLFLLCKDNGINSVVQLEQAIKQAIKENQEKRKEYYKNYYLKKKNINKMNINFILN